MNNQQYLDNCETMNFQNGNIKATAKVPKLLFDITYALKPHRYIQAEHIFLSALTTYAYSQQNNFIVKNIGELTKGDDTGLCDDRAYTIGHSNALNLNLFSMVFIPQMQGVTSTLRIFENMLPYLYDKYKKPALSDKRALLAVINSKKANIESKQSCLKQLEEKKIKNVNHMYYVCFLQRCPSFRFLGDRNWFNRYIASTFITCDSAYPYRKDFLTQIFNKQNNFDTIATILNIRPMPKVPHLTLQNLKQKGRNFGRILMCNYADINEPTNDLDTLHPVNKDDERYQKFKNILSKNLEPNVENALEMSDFRSLTGRFDKYFVAACIKNYWKELHFNSEAINFIDDLKQKKYIHTCFEPNNLTFKNWKFYSADDLYFNENILKTTLKIAALFHLAAGLNENTKISKECVENAFEVAKFYIENSFKVIGNL